MNMAITINIVSLYEIMITCIVNTVLLCILAMKGQVAQAVRPLATGYTVRVRSRVSERWRFFFTPSCPEWLWGPLNLV